MKEKQANQAGQAGGEDAVTDDRTHAPAGATSRSEKKVAASNSGTSSSMLPSIAGGGVSGKGGGGTKGGGTKGYQPLDEDERGDPAPSAAAPSKHDLPLLGGGANNGMEDDGSSGTLPPIGFGGLGGAAGSSTFSGHAGLSVNSKALLGSSKNKPGMVGKQQKAGKLGGNKVGSGLGIKPVSMSMQIGGNGLTMNSRSVSGFQGEDPGLAVVGGNSSHHLEQESGSTSKKNYTSPYSQPKSKKK